MALPFQGARRKKLKRRCRLLMLQEGGTLVGRAAGADPSSTTALRLLQMRGAPQARGPTAAHGPGASAAAQAASMGVVLELQMAPLAARGQVVGLVAVTGAAKRGAALPRGRQEVGRLVANRGATAAEPAAAATMTVIGMAAGIMVIWRMTVRRTHGSRGGGKGAARGAPAEAGAAAGAAGAEGLARAAGGLVSGGEGRSA